MSNGRPICVLISALGGQGGGVLVDWLVAAARIDDLPAQATSTPGVAQRTGATTYYFEVYAQKTPGSSPIFSIFPASGAVDLLVSFEPMETGRALTTGYIGPETSVITARKRIYSTEEKIKAGDGAVPAEPVLNALQNCAGKLCVVDMAKVAKDAGCHPNAVMYGAMVASGVLPMNPDSCRMAIEFSGVAVESNLAGFKVGLNLPVAADDPEKEPDTEFMPAPSAFANAISGFPEAVQQMAGHGAAHLLDYQGKRYVRRYLDYLREAGAADSAAQSFRLSIIVARRLAAWMAFEDIIRVAQLKTRKGRLTRIRNDLGLADDVPLIVHDYLKPGRDELESILPVWLARLLPKSRKRKYATGLALKFRTSSPFGWLTMRALAGLRFWRPATARFSHEHKMIKRWLQAIAEAAAVDYDLACDAADLAVWARGYGDTRKGGMTRLDALFSDWAERISNDKSALRNAVSASLLAANSNPDTEVPP